MYETAREINDRLAGTIVLWKGQPIYVSEAGTKRDGTLFLYTATIPDLLLGPQIDLDDPDLDLFGMQLGYVNTPYNAAVYTKRMPNRRMQQGLNGHNVHVEPAVTRDGHRINYNSIYAKQCFADMLAGKYPTLQEARQMLLDNPNLDSVAFGRKFAIKREAPGFPYYLMYRGRRAGWSDLSCERFNLPEDQQFLAELLKAEGIAA